MNIPIIELLFNNPPNAAQGGGVQSKKTAPSFMTWLEKIFQGSRQFIQRLTTTQKNNLPTNLLGYKTETAQVTPFVAARSAMINPFQVQSDPEGTETTPRVMESGAGESESGSTVGQNPALGATPLQPIPEPVTAVAQTVQPEPITNTATREICPAGVIQTESTVSTIDNSLEISTTPLPIQQTIIARNEATPPISPDQSGASATASMMVAGQAAAVDSASKPDTITAPPQSMTDQAVSEQAAPPQAENVPYQQITDTRPGPVVPDTERSAPIVDRIVQVVAESETPRELNILSSQRSASEITISPQTSADLPVDQLAAGIRSAVPADGSPQVVANPDQAAPARPGQPVLQSDPANDAIPKPFTVGEKASEPTGDISSTGNGRSAERKAAADRSPEHFEIDIKVEQTASESKAQPAPAQRIIITAESADNATPPVTKFQHDWPATPQVTIKTAAADSAEQKATIPTQPDSGEPVAVQVKSNEIANQLGEKSFPNQGMPKVANRIIVESAQTNHPSASVRHTAPKVEPTLQTGQPTATQTNPERPESGATANRESVSKPVTTTAKSEVNPKLPDSEPVIIKAEQKAGRRSAAEHNQGNHEAYRHPNPAVNTKGVKTKVSFDLRNSNTDLTRPAQSDSPSDWSEKVTPEFNANANFTSQLPETMYAAEKAFRMALINRVTQLIEQSQHKDRREMTFRLQTDSKDTIEMQFIKEVSTNRGKILINSESMAEAIQRQLPTILQNLDTKGIHFAELSVQVNNGEQFSTPNRHQTNKATDNKTEPARAIQESGNESNPQRVFYYGYNTIDYVA